MSYNNVMDLYDDMNIDVQNLNYFLSRDSQLSSLDSGN